MPPQEDDLELEEGTNAFDPASLPLGTLAAFNVSDQPMWTSVGEADPDREGEQKNKLSDEQKNAILAMVNSCARADSVARRIEVQGAWLLQLLDRGFHNITPRNGGWNIQGQATMEQGYGIYASAMARNNHPTNVIGEKNDIIVSLFMRDLCESTFFPEKPDSADDQTYSDCANSLKHFVCEDNKYGKRQGEVGRLYCTDEFAMGYTRPVADAQNFGYEDSMPDVAPEAEGGDDPDAAQTESKRPAIRAVTDIWGKLYWKRPIMAQSLKQMGYCMLNFEQDVALSRATFPWIADQIEPMDLGISEMKLDRLARQSINMAMQSNYATGDSLARDCTNSAIWMRPGMYMDDSCPKPLRSWFWTEFPKGFLAWYAGKTLAFVRNEGMDEVLTEFHARTGNGQNRRALTESYAWPQLRLNVLVDLWDEFCRKEIPRTALLSPAWNVPAIRSSSVRVGAFEPVDQSQIPAGQTLANTMAPFPQPTHVPTLPDFIMWLSGPLAEQLTHAMPALAASENNDPETLGQSKLQNDNAMSSFGESWRDMCEGFANITTQAVSWNARVQPEDKCFDANFPSKGRKTARIAALKLGKGVARADGTANFPETWSERQKVWDDLFKAAPENPLVAGILGDPRTMAGMREFLPKGIILPGVDAVEKQQGEFDVLMKTAPMDNPDFIKAQGAAQKLAGIVQQGSAEVAQMGPMVQPEMQQKLQQAQQMLTQAQQQMQQMPPMVSSVPVRPTDNHQVEATVTLGMINSSEGRRLGSSKAPKDQAIFQNLNLHYQQHAEEAKKQALQNAKPVPPKTSISIDPSKLPPGEQAAALTLAGIPADAANIEQDREMAPHEYSTTEKGVGPTGSEIERKVSVVGKKLD